MKISDSLVPYNHTGSSATTPSDPSNIASNSKSDGIKIYIKERSMGEYNLGQSLCITELPLSPKSYGRSLITKQQSEPPSTLVYNTFISGGTISKEAVERNANYWLKT